MEIKAPNPIPTGVRSSVFLAGSIEMGAAEDWQRVAAEAFLAAGRVVFNPRRNDFDSFWVQSIENDGFREQVEWELDALERANIVFMYFALGTKSPISLLELGMYAGTGKLVVVCPHGFWRKGNVDIVCKRYGTPLFESLDTAIQWTLAQGEFAAMRRTAE